MAESPIRHAAPLNARLQAHVDTENWLGALREALQHGAIQDDATLERELVHWRIAAFRQVTRDSRPGAWPPRYPDPFPARAGVPELPAAELTLPALAGCVMHHGCVLVRGLLDTAEIDRLRGDIDHAFEDQHRAVMDLPAMTPTPWYARLPVEAARQKKLPDSRQFVEDGHGVLIADSPRSLADLIGVFENHGVTSLLERYFGERPALSVGKSTLRRVPPDLMLSGWHQDGAFLGAGIRSMNAWLSLSHCGVDASGLDLVPRRLDHIVETGTGDAIFPWAASDAAVLEAAGRHGIASPVFAPGDALFFDHMLMHRTGIPAGMCKPRWAIESWFFAPTEYPMDQIPVCI